MPVHVAFLVFAFAFLILVSLWTCVLAGENLTDHRHNIEPVIGQKWNNVSENLTLTFKCADGEIALLNVQGPDPECYPKAGLYKKCKVKEQCTVKYSYCAIDFDVDEESPENFSNESSDEPSEESSDDSSEEELQKICKCNVGFMPSSDRTACIRIQKCSFMTSNPNYTQEDCPFSKQFCQNGHCLCKTNYAYNRDGVCVWFSPYKEPNVQPVESIMIKPTEADSQWILFGHPVWHVAAFVLGTILVWILVVFGLYKLFRSFFPQPKPENEQHIEEELQQLNNPNPNYILRVED